MRVLFLAGFAACAPVLVHLDPAEPARRLPAQSADDGVLTLESAVALGAGAAARAAQLHAEAASAGVLAARAVDVPQLRIGVNDLTSRATQPSVDGQLRVPVPNPWVERAELAAARAAQLGAQADADAARRAAEEAVVLAFVRAYTADRPLEAATRRAAAERAWRTHVDQQRAEGLADEADVVGALADEADGVVDEVTARGEVDAARAALAGLIHRPVVTLAVPTLPELPDNADAAAGASLGCRAELAAIQAARESARAAAAEAGAEAIPWFDWIEGRVGGQAGLPADGGVRVAIRLPLWAWGTGERRVATGEAAAWDAELDVAVAELSGLARSAWSSWRAALAAEAAWRGALAAVRARAPADASQTLQVDREVAAVDVRATEAERDALFAAWNLALITCSAP